MSKVVIQGNASGTGNFTIAAPNSNTDRTLTLPDAGGTLDRLDRAGNVLQVVQSTLTTTFTNSSATWQDTGLSLSITPSLSSNKILLQWSIPNGNDVGTASNGFNLVRDGSNIAQGTGGTYNLTSSNDSGGAAHAGVNSLVYLDSPSTTSAITYKVQMRNQSGCTGHINRTSQFNGGTDVYQHGMISTLIAMEIAA